MGTAYGPPGNWMGCPPANIPCEPPAGWPWNLFRVPLSLSILIDSPIRTDLPFSPVGAFIVPLVDSNILFGSLVIAGLNLLTNFLLKCHLVTQPVIPQGPAKLNQITLSMDQLTKLISAYLRGQPVERFFKEPGSDSGSFGGDEPLFPDNLSVSLMLTAPFADFDGSPDTSFNVPLFEIPGLQGGLMIALLILIARYIFEQGGLGMVCPGGDPPAVDQQGLLRYLMTLKGSNGVR